MFRDGTRHAEGHRRGLAKQRDHPQPVALADDVAFDV
jgi:hypothetical protein